MRTWSDFVFYIGYLSYFRFYCCRILKYKHLYVRTKINMHNVFIIYLNKYICRSGKTTDRFSLRYLMFFWWFFFFFTILIFYLQFGFWKFALLLYWLSAYEKKYMIYVYMGLLFLIFPNCLLWFVSISTNYKYL